jgi:hypothetical protein
LRRPKANPKPEILTDSDSEIESAPEVDTDAETNPETQNWVVVNSPAEANIDQQYVDTWKRRKPGAQGCHA